MLVKIRVILLLCLLKTQTDAYKILSIFPIQSYSHYIFIEPLLKQLAERGHEITSITPYPQNEPLKNFRDIVTLEQFEEFTGEANNVKDVEYMSYWQFLKFVHDINRRIFIAVMDQLEIQQLLSDPRQTFDLVIIDVCFSEAFFGFGAHFGAPIIGAATFGAHSWNTAIAVINGAPTLPSFMPYPFLSYAESMSFCERLYNFIAYFYEYYFMYFKHLPRHAKLFEHYFGHTGYTFADVQKNVSVVLLNQHSSLGVSRPYVPNMIDVGGMQVSSQINPLPGNIQQFLDNATKGAIYFSLGTNLKSSKLPPVKINAILNAFRALPQRILWKFEISNVTNKPENVFISSWFPQSDVLAHPNIKLFITHGGLLSITESIARGKPVLGIPFFADQFMNMARAQKLGFGLPLDFNEFSELKFLHAIQELLSNSSYAQMAQTISQRYHDKPQTAMETAIYWVEYVLRHRGAHHLHCEGMNLNIFQYYSLDVMMLVLAVLMIPIAATILSLRALCRKDLKKKKLKTQ